MTRFVALCLAAGLAACGIKGEPLSPGPALALDTELPGEPPGSG